MHHVCLGKSINQGFSYTLTNYLLSHDPTRSDGTLDPSFSLIGDLSYVKYPGVSLRFLGLRVVVV